jgi:hypothetical protein
MEKNPNQAHFSKNSIQNVGPNLNGKNEKPKSTNIDFIQKLRFFQTAKCCSKSKMKVQSFQKA